MTKMEGLIVLLSYIFDQPTTAVENELRESDIRSWADFEEELNKILAGSKITIKVIETGDRDWFKPGIHLRNPSPKLIADAKEDAINKGHDTVYAHRVEEKPQMTKRR